ncbi:heptahelical transmembrane protein 1-like [Impatiens glandulifera]|uniref:heptahelical transmembrane protein 1-like n=1 Tax=Impatiens glandulifera TaxID=253017 RepID=UPI001FB10BE6|nr:heptahelical transmembrane protein 1-like [Impatiens glandulifera]
MKRVIEGSGSIWKRKMTEIDQKEIGSINSTSSIAITPQTTTKGGKKKTKGVKKKKNKPKQPPLLLFHELPEYMKDNEYILRHYRANWSIRQAFLSLFRWHNETLNVWTHLIGFGLFLSLTMANFLPVPHLVDFLCVFPSSLPVRSEANTSQNLMYPVPTKLIDLNQPSSTEMDWASSSSPAVVEKWPFFIFLAGAMFCLLSSSSCHLFCCHSHNLNIFLLRIDYVGIAVMIITSFFPPIYYIFQCQPLWQILYLSGISVMGTITIVTLLTPTFSSGKYRGFRALLFVGMGLFGLIPAVHGTVVNWNEPRRKVILAYESAMAVFYLTGTGFYVSRIPERFKPGWFDLAGHSHQIFHVFVVLGALAHYGAALIFLEYREKVGC